jgi:TPR repeat protein
MSMPQRVILLWLVGGSMALADLQDRQILIPTEAGDYTMSSNWLEAARAALPARYLAKGDLNYQETTNLICQESQHGNNAALGLWGVVLLVQSRTPEEAEAALKLARNSARNGYVRAMLQLGFLFEGNKYVHKDYREAFQWFSLAAERGDPLAQFETGVCYVHGLGTDADPAKGADYYRRSAGQTNYVAMKSLGYLLMNGLGVKKDLDEAKYWSARAAIEGGNARAMYNLGVLCCTNFPDSNSMTEAFRWFKKSADLGDPLAAYELCTFYYHGWGVESNLDNYHLWRFKSANLGDTQAQYELGAAYRTGDGVPQDTNAALDWYDKAAAKNNPNAFYDLALHYLDDKTNEASRRLAADYMTRAAKGGHREAQFQCALSCFRGDDAPVDFEGGKQWLTTAAENGWGPAEFLLFQLYLYGASPATGCPRYPKDSAEAVKWLRRAADHKNMHAQSVLAVMLIQGTDMDKDTLEAERLLRDAAEHGYAQAQNDLGLALLNGDVGTTNPVEAAVWCKLAVARSTDPVVLKRGKVNLTNAWSRLTEDQQSEADRRVRDFQPRPVVQIDPMVKDWDKNPAYEQEDMRFGQ